MEIVLYSTGCPKCNILHKKLDAKGIAYRVEENEDIIMAVANRAGVMSMPLLQVGDKILTFNEANQWVNDYE